MHSIADKSYRVKPAEKVGRILYVGRAGLFRRFVCRVYRASGKLRLIDLAGTTGRGGDDGS